MIFHYGGANPESLSQILGCSSEEIIMRAQPVVLTGWAMCFNGKSNSWNKKSTASLFPIDAYYTRGFCIQHTLKEIDKLNTFYGYPIVHDRMKIIVTEVDRYADKQKPGYATFKHEVNSSKMTGDQSEFFTGEDTLLIKRTFEAKAYIRNAKQVFVYPDKTYLIECCKNFYTHLQLKGDDLRQIREFIIEVRKADNYKMVDEFRYPIIKQQWQKYGLGLCIISYQGGANNNFEMKKNQTIKFMREKVIDIDEKDAQVWQLITDVPKIKSPWQYVCFILNVIIPGLGTMIVSGFSPKWSKTLFMVGVFQLFLAYILIGWIFSIYWGILIVRKSWEDQAELQNFLEKTNVRSDQQQPAQSYARLRELFSLPKKEVIFDDFGCSYNSGILHTGRMYLTENYICFYSSIMGITKRVIVPLNDVTQVSKAKSLGMIKAIKIYTQAQAGKKSSYKFQSFSDCNKTYKIIQKLWSNVSPYAQQNKDVSEEEDDDDDNQSQMSMSTVTRGTELAQTQDKLNVQGGQLDSSIDGKQEPKIIISNDNNSSILERSLSHRLSGSGINNEEIKLDQQPSAIDDQRTLSDGLNGNKKQTDEKQGVQVEKAQGLNELNERSKQGKDKENPFEYITKDELEKLLDPYPVGENMNEMEKICLNMGALDFFNQVAVHSGIHSFEKFYAEKGEQKIQAQDWVIPEPAEEYDGKPVQMASQMFVEFQIKDNPFVKVSPTTKYYKLLEKTDQKVCFKILSKCSGVPYCDTFAIEEEFLILAPSPGAPICVVRIMMQVIYYKSTIFKSKITSSSIKGSKDVWTEWVEWFKRKGLAFKEKKAPQAANKLKHGIEKSNKLFEKKNDEPAEAQKQVQKKNFKDKLENIVNQAQLYASEYRVEILLFLIMLFLIQVILKLNSLEYQLAQLSNNNTNCSQNQ
ncbi:UNKNOWN [Stylonychia lemnae]|uniref:VASt domain-containing protein n=1 Tax=Stylonychia lemnae TaxID=5949 RepID=A0A078AYV0_STYLE|nr:UNKNOWN [Stylonychia lemnae]|eukprot:CDW85958.1 UNKNOWN [Stylonychia lemnae]